MAFNWSFAPRFLFVCLLCATIYPTNHQLKAEEKYYQKCNSLLESKEIDKALEEYKQAEKKEQISAYLYNNIGFAYYLKKDLENAEIYYTKAIKLDPGLAVTYNNLGVVYHNKKDFPKAAEYYKKALKLQPKYAKAAYNLAVVNYRLKKYFKAARLYLKAKRMDRSYGEERFKKERLIRSVKEELKTDPQNKDLKKALEFLQKDSQ